jgi:hypothetical protein
LLVRRPRAAASFNGTVVVEWLNVSAGQDLDFVYAATRELLVREGYVWIGLSAQRVGVDRCASWDPQRYGDLSVEAPNVDPEDGALLDPPVATTGARGGDVLCWDICSQVAALLQSPQSREFIGGAVQEVIAAGESQSAFRLSSYFNSIQPLHGLYDGFLLYDRGGPFALRADVGALLVGIGTEFMSAYLRAPSPPDSDNQRWWEIAGAGHVSLEEMSAYIDPQTLRDGAQRAGSDIVSLSGSLAREFPDAPYPLWSRVRNGDVMKAALSSLTRWIRGGAPPASVPRLVMDDDGRLVRDAQGRVLGGIRTPTYEVPTAQNVGTSKLGCPVAGWHRDFSAEEMRARYQSPDHYRAEVRTVVAANLEQGVLLVEESEVLLCEAEKVSFQGEAT